MNPKSLFLALALAAMLCACSQTDKTNETTTNPTSPTAPAHQTRFVTVGDSVKLEVLDWGGTGKPLLFLAGLSNTAHVFNEFAPKFTDRHHVYGLTRRGFGQSSTPKTGYDIATLTTDIRVILDSLHIDKVSLVGHSFAGDEMTKFAGLYPNRVNRIIYLDAAYDNLEGMKTLADPPVPPQPTARDSASLANLRSYQHTMFGVSIPLEELQQTSKLSEEGRYLGDKTPGFVFGAIMGQLVHPDYTQVQCPALAIYAEPVSIQKIIPFLTRLDSLEQQRSVKKFQVFQQRFRTESVRFQKGVTHGQVKMIKDALHPLFLSHPAETEKLMRDFLK